MLRGERAYLVMGGAAQNMSAADMVIVEMRKGLGEECESRRWRWSFSREGS